MLFNYLRAHWVARHRFPLPSRIVSLVRAARALLFFRTHRSLYQLDVIRDYVAPAAPGELFRHFCCRHYLSRDLPWQMRASCALHHYRYEDSNFGPTYKHMVYRGNGLPLWSSVEGETLFAIRLVRAIGLQAEGDLSVVLLAGEDRLHCISFSWVSGLFAGVSAPVVPFIARNQGCRRNELDVQRRFSKAFPQNSANLFCFSAMEGIAKAISAPGIVGVRADKQVCYEWQHHDHFANAYDSFWHSVGATALSHQGAVIPVPVPLKPLPQVAAKHRKRAMARRQHWAAVSEAARAAIMPHIVVAQARAPRLVSDAAGGDAQPVFSSNGRDWEERRRARR